jgi:hypothetical protein
MVSTIKKNPSSLSGKPIWDASRLCVRSILSHQDTGMPSECLSASYLLVPGGRRIDWVEKSETAPQSTVAQSVQALFEEQHQQQVQVQGYSTL